MRPTFRFLLLCSVLSSLLNVAAANAQTPADAASSDRTSWYEQARAARLSAFQELQTARITIDARASSWSSPAAICAQVRLLEKTADPKVLATLDGFRNLQRDCGEYRETAAFVPIALAVAQGAGDFLVERAKEELSVYARNQIKDKICQKEDPIQIACPSDASMSLTLQPHDVLANTCTQLGVMESAGVDSDLALLQESLLMDLRALPGVVGTKLVSDCSALPPLERDVVGDVVMVLANTLTSWRRDEFIADATHRFALDVIARAGAKQAQTCSLSQGNKFDTRCGMLFGAVLMRNLTEAFVRASDVPPYIPRALADAATDFCASFGLPVEASDGACIWHGFQDSKWKPIIEEIYQAIREASRSDLDISASVRSSASDVTPERVVRRALGIMGRLSIASAKVVAATGGDAKAQMTLEWVGLAGTTLSDKGLAGGLLELLASGKVLDKPLPKNTVRVAILLTRLAKSTDRDDAREAIAAFSEPVGSYRGKYDRDDVGVSLNGYLGPFVGLQRNYHRRPAADDIQATDFTTRLAGPIGLDLTFTSGSYTHFGIIVGLVDPFALTAVNDSGKLSDATLASVITPALYFRLGLLRTPLAALVGASFQPFLQSDDQCNGGPCFRGAVQVGGAVAVDIPLLTLH
jgi:hypothetical protein